MSSMFAPKPTPAPDVPKPKPAAPMPDEFSPATLEAKRRKQLEMMQRGGRQSTILSDAAGRGDYAGSTLG